MKPKKFSQFESFSDDSETRLVETEVSRVQESAPSYEVFKNPEERHFLLDVADNFIDQIRDQENPYDFFVFFDRGARLFGHLIRERWAHRFPEDKMPDTFFVKIGREMGQPSPDPDQPVYYEYPWESIFKRDWIDDKLPSVSEVIDRIKDNARFKKLVESLRKSFSRNNKATFDRKRVLLVDEFMASGATLSYGKELFSRAFSDVEVDGAGLVARFENYSGYPSIVKPISGNRIPPSLGNPDYAGVKLPIPPSKEYRDQFFIKPKQIDPLKKRIEEIEKEIELTEEKVEKIPSNRRVKRKKGNWGVEFVAHPLIDKLKGLKEELKQTHEERENVRERMERYQQARKEIHSIALMD